MPVKGVPRGQPLLYSSASVILIVLSFPSADLQEAKMCSVIVPPCDQDNQCNKTQETLETMSHVSQVCIWQGMRRAQTTVETRLPAS